MAETVAQIIARLPSSDDLVRDMLRALRRRKPFPTSRAQTPDPLWVRVMAATTHGSGFSRAICIKYGLDPDEKWMP